eukprot:GSChrysophyteH1.ASY1.ANO1.2469.1 assembled CDS
MSSHVTSSIYVAFLSISVFLAKYVHNTEVQVEDPAFLVAKVVGELLLLVAVPIALFISFTNRYVTAEPDQWQLLIRDGKLVDAGIGSCHFKGFFDRVVRFPSSIQKVEFRVEQVTSEMQGVIANGFVMWSVHREGEGPWKAYKNLQLRDIDEDGNVDTSSGSDHIKSVATSIIRVAIAQMSLHQCLTNRDEIRAACRAKMMEQLVGWGVWLETIEITDMLVASRHLFEDMQCEFRNDQRIKAERIRLSTERTLQKEKIDADLEHSKRKTEAETAKTVAILEQNLLCERKRAELLEQEQEVQAQRLSTEESMKRAVIESEKRLEDLKQKNKNDLLEQENESQLKILSAQDHRVAHLGEKELLVMQMETCHKVYQSVKDIKINSFVGANDGASTVQPSSMLPGLGVLSTTAAQWEVIRNA